MRAICGLAELGVETHDAVCGRARSSCGTLGLARGIGCDFKSVNAGCAEEQEDAAPRQSLGDRRSSHCPLEMRISRLEERPRLHEAEARSFGP